MILNMQYESKKDINIFFAFDKGLLVLKAI